METSVNWDKRAARVEIVVLGKKVGERELAWVQPSD